MMRAITVSGLTRRYGVQATLSEVNLDLEPGSITGLLGRNGAGKTTLMRIIAGQEFATHGTVEVFGASPVENDQILRRIMFVPADQAYPDIKVGDALRAASWFYPNWSPELTERLMADFALPAGRAIKKLSRGMRSALGIVLALSARAEITMLDEPCSGLDEVARRVFYDRLLTDYTETPRTVLLSTHHVDEVAGLLERVVVMDRGKVVIDAGADDLRGAATRVSGPVLAVQEFTAGRAVWDRRRLGSQETAVVVGALGTGDRIPACTSRLTLEPVPLPELVRYAADRVPDDMPWKAIA